jgi:hypothetical protein
MDSLNFKAGWQTQEETRKISTGTLALRKVSAVVPIRAGRL